MPLSSTEFALESLQKPWPGWGHLVPGGDQGVLALLCLLCPTFCPKFILYWLCALVAELYIESASLGPCALRLPACICQVGNTSTRPGYLRPAISILH